MASELTLIIGGAASGKSLFAERLAGLGTAVTYIATAHPIDDEMTAKIKIHRQRRPEGWHTVELSGPDLLKILPEVAGDIVIIDGLTLYVAMALNDLPDPLEHVGQVAEALRQMGQAVLVVSDEVGMGLVPESPRGRAFRELLGAANQEIARAADNVYFVAAGLPLTLKGRELRGGAG